MKKKIVGEFDVKLNTKLLNSLCYKLLENPLYYNTTIPLRTRYKHPLKYSELPHDFEFIFPSAGTPCLYGLSKWRRARDFSILFGFMI